ncbi:lipopolysaccharide kinase InaA family protein [Tundrisphaera lichenicola]|uniref:lipopolysaccharide kinase InaA family protein n=1 Tax=Tundrisphaera lichenicola TaxID=2029860 RepID=UPI003EB751D1
MTGSHGDLLTRLTRGTRWSWRAERHASTLPPDFESSVMALETSDQHHAKQGRSTARVRFDSGPATLSVFLKRHYRLPWPSRIGALLNPAGRHSPASAEWAHLERARGLGIPVPEVVAAGEWIGPWGMLQSYLMVAELIGHAPLHEAVPELSRTLDPAAFASMKRAIIAEMARITAKLHAAWAFHKDLYLCHFFLDLRPGADRRPKLCLIDLHRLAVHRWTAPRWRWKDLGQLLFSTYGVRGIDDRDRLRFWMHYRRHLAVILPSIQSRIIRDKAARYLAHNQ